MPDDDWALGQNEVDVRNEQRRSAQGGERVSEDRHVSVPGRVGPIELERCETCGRDRPKDEIDELDGKRICLDCAVALIDEALD